MLKRHECPAKLAWCPSKNFPNLVASGATTGIMEEQTYETKATLEILDLNLSEYSDDMKVLGSISMKEPFSSVAWGMKGFGENGPLSKGVIAGGMNDGTLNIWSASAIEQGNTATALLSKSEVHKGSVNALDFHTLAAHYLASGGSDGEVYVWDLSNPSELKPFRPNAVKIGTPQPTKPAVHHVHWNKVAHQLLASVNEHGETNIWDLRQKKMVVSVRPSSRQNLRPSGLRWNHDHNFAVSFFGNGAIDFWDLRKPVVVKTKFDTLSSSVTGIDWHPTHKEWLLSSDDHGYTTIWDTVQNTVVSRSLVSNSMYDCKWLPHSKQYFSYSSYDGYVAVHQTDNTPVPDADIIPKGAISFGFGSKCVTTGRDNVVDEKTKKVTNKHPHIAIHSLPINQTLVEASQAALSSVDQSALVNFVAQQVQQHESTTQALEWQILSALLTNQSNDVILDILGVKKPESVAILKANAATSTGTGTDSATTQGDGSTNELYYEPSTAEDLNYDLSADPVSTTPASTLTSPAADKPQSALTNNTSNTSTASSSGSTSSSNTTDIPAEYAISHIESKQYDEDVVKCLIMGDVVDAIDLCLTSHRYTDALLLAVSAGPEHAARVSAEIAKTHRDPHFSQLLTMLSTKDILHYVNHSDVEHWRDTLAVILAYSGDDTITHTQVLLAKITPYTSQDPTRTLILAMLAGDLAKCIEIWSTYPGLFQNPAQEECKEASTQDIPALHYTMVRTIVAYAALRSKNVSHIPLVQTLNDYALLLCANGAAYYACYWIYTVAMYIGGVTTEISEIAQRIIYSQPANLQAEFSMLVQNNQPLVNVEVDPSMAQRVAMLDSMKMQKQAELEAFMQQQQQHQHQQQPHQPPTATLGAMPPQAVTAAPVAAAHHQPMHQPIQPIQPMQPTYTQHQQPPQQHGMTPLHGATAAPVTTPTYQAKPMQQQPMYNQHQPQQHQQQPMYNQQQPMQPMTTPAAAANPWAQQQQQQQQQQQPMTTPAAATNPWTQQQQQHHQHQQSMVAQPQPQAPPQAAAYTPTEDDTQLIEFIKQYVDQLATACGPHSPDGKNLAKVQKPLSELYTLILTGKLSCRQEITQLVQLMCTSVSQAMALQQQLVNTHLENNTAWLSAIKIVLTVAKKFMP